MGILGINNRTENWKTVQHFHGLSDPAKVALVRRLGGPNDTTADEVSLELFWHGMRDYAYEYNVEDDDLVEIYETHFPLLREEIMEFEGANRFAKLQAHNYIVPVSVSDRKSLADNLKNTEVDIVLETPERIFIGEAKDESDLGTSGRLILVHQLIRQYVTATVLVDLLGCPEKKIVPFVVTDKNRLGSTNNKAQVTFMIEQKWLRRKNVLSWGQVNDITT